jgi:uncharacterized membrane protein YcfT
MAAWLVALLVARQIIPPMTAGFVAGTIGRRAALPHSLLVGGAMLTCVASVAVWQGVSMRTFAVALVVNVTFFALSCLTGGVAAVLWMRRRGAEDAPAAD